MMNSLYALLSPLIGVVIAAICAWLTKYLTNLAKAANAGLAAAPAEVKQIVALLISSALALVTAIAGLHLGSISTVPAVVIQALIGWVGSMTLYNSKPSTPSAPSTPA